MCRVHADDMHKLDSEQRNHMPDLTDKQMDKLISAKERMLRSVKDDPEAYMPEFVSLCDEVTRLRAEVERLKADMETRIRWDENVKEGLRQRLAELEAAGAWRPIAEAPKGTWNNGPLERTHPDYVEPPRLLLAVEDNQICVGYADLYYSEFGNGYDAARGFWCEEVSGQRVIPHLFQPLPSPPPRTT